MTASTSTTEPTHVPAPVIRTNRPYCPRCDALLRFSHDEYACLTCGYEYVLDVRELELLREGRQPLRPAASIAGLSLTAGFMTGSGLIVAGLIAGGSLVFMLVRRFRRTSVG